MVKKVLWMLGVAAVFAAMVLAMLLLGGRIAGLTPYGVFSDSMEPTLSAGDLVFVREIKTEEIRSGMVLTFREKGKLESATKRVTNVLVRTMALEPIADGENRIKTDRSGRIILKTVQLDEPAYYFWLCGDAEPQDAAVVVQAGDVLGAPVYALPRLGDAMAMLGTPAGKLATACTGILAVWMLFRPETTRRSRKRKAREDTILCDRQAVRDDELVVLDENAGEEDDIFFEER